MLTNLRDCGVMLLRLFCLFLLVACAPSERLQRSYVHNTDVWQTVSRDIEVFRDRADHVLARTIILEGGGEIAYYLSLSFLHGKRSRPQILSVTQDGRLMPYELHDRFSTFCIDHCHKAEIGQIRLTQAQFRTAGNEGMALQIDGVRRNYTTNIPARLFYSALQAANLLESGHTDSHESRFLDL
ncbi:hypothetical protein [Yoonia sp. MH D7]